MFLQSLFSNLASSEKRHLQAPLRTTKRGKVFTVGGHTGDGGGARVSSCPRLQASYVGITHFACAKDAKLKNAVNLKRKVSHR